MKQDNHIQLTLGSLLHQRQEAMNKLVVDCQKQNILPRLVKHINNLDEAIKAMSNLVPDVAVGISPVPQRKTFKKASNHFIDLDKNLIAIVNSFYKEKGAMDTHTIWKLINVHEDKRYMGIKEGTVGGHLSTLFSNGLLMRINKNGKKHYIPAKGREDNIECKSEKTLVNSDIEPIKIFLRNTLKGEDLSAKKILDIIKDTTDYKCMSQSRLSIILHSLLEQGFLIRELKYIEGVRRGVFHYALKNIS